MANKDGTGPRTTSTGPRDGRGNGLGQGGKKANVTIKGIGKKTGGKKGSC